MKDTIKMYLFASSIPFFFCFCSDTDITTYFMTEAFKPLLLTEESIHLPELCLS